MSLIGLTEKNSKSSIRSKAIDSFCEPPSITQYVHVARSRDVHANATNAYLLAVR